jgi:hypothetical protein
MYAGLEKFVNTHLEGSPKGSQILKNSQKKYKIYKLLEFLNLEKILLNRRFEKLQDTTAFEKILKEVINVSNK